MSGSRRCCCALAFAACRARRRARRVARVAAQAGRAPARRPAALVGLAHALEAAGRPGEAADHIVRHLERWPDRPADGWRALGRCAYRAGRRRAGRARARARDRHEPAATPRRGSTSVSRSSGTAHARARRGALRGGGSSRTRATPGTACCCRACRTWRAATGAAAATAWSRCSSMCPSATSAREARRVLAECSAPALRLRDQGQRGRPLRLERHAGGRGRRPGRRLGERRRALRFRLAVHVAPVFGERRPFQLTAAYGRSDYAELTDYASQTFAGSAAGLLPLGERAALRVDGGVGYTLLDNDPYLLSAGLRPSLLVAVGIPQRRAAYPREWRASGIRRRSPVRVARAQRLALRRRRGARAPPGHESQVWIAWGGSG